MEERILNKNTDIYISRLPILGIILGIVAFILGYIQTDSMLFAPLWELVFFGGNVLIWIPARIIFNRIKKHE